MINLRWLIAAALGILATLATAAVAQTAPTVVPMQPGSSYDPARCFDVQFAGGLYVCSAPPTPTPTPVATLNGTPLCAHDSTRWHPLVETNADGSVRCTYGHEHGMNPTQLDSTFGALPLTQQISYPWATISATGVQENSTANKHGVYKWLEAGGLPCSAHAPDGSHKAITAFRAELHADGSLGAAVRFHSYWGQFQVGNCDTSQRGTISVGGHLDYAILTVGAGKERVPLSNDPPTGCNISGDSRQEGKLGEAPQARSVWYGTSIRPPGCDDSYGISPHLSVAWNIDTANWGPVDPNNPNAILLYGSRAGHDGTSISTDAITIWVSGFPADSNGLVTFNGHVDRHGNVVPEQGGAADAIDYIPLHLSNVTPGAYSGNGRSGASLQADPIIYSGDVVGPDGKYGYYVAPPQQ